MSLVSTRQAERARPEERSIGRGWEKGRRTWLMPVGQTSGPLELVSYLFCICCIRPPLTPYGVPLPSGIHSSSPPSWFLRRKKKKKVSCLVRPCRYLGLVVVSVCRVQDRNKGEEFLILADISHFSTVSFPSFCLAVVSRGPPCSVSSV